ncbi:MAG: hypothetical protein ACKVIM_01820 [Flavobacteriales bacterium]|jgi:hypothetical protein|tara:strand:- start:48 stop:248 length:201 start_codon:yes stop_codon:yes gene_type:complete
MNALINLVLAIVLNFLSNGTNHPDLINHAVKEDKNQSYQLEDLRSHYLITKEEVNKFSNHQLKRNT